MVSNELLSELHNLSRVEKLRVMQFLASELALEEESLLTPGAHYEVWSPYDAPSAAQTLLEMLKDDEKSHNG